MGTRTVMAMTSDLYRLMTWLSPAFPVGAYSFSHGLEHAVETGLVSGVDDARDWIRSLLTMGDGHADLVFLGAAWSAADNEDSLREVHELALAFQPSREIFLESTAQGTAFLKTTAATWPCAAIDLLGRMSDGAVAYPVAVGAIAGSHGVDRHAALHAYAHAFVANLVSAAVRLIPLGQTDGQAITAALQADVALAAQRAAETPLELVTSSCLMADISSMQHEVQYSRLFRS
jgi:urease accessory protein